MSERTGPLKSDRLFGHAILLGSFALLALGLLAWQAPEVGWRDPGLERWLLATLVLAAWAALVAGLRYRRPPAADRRPVPVADAEAPQSPVALPVEPGVAVAGVPPPARLAATADTLRVIYASQTGFAEQLARQTLHSLQAAGKTARLDALDTLSLGDLRGDARVLFVVSTTGDGDPPDNALRFFDTCMAQPADLRGLRFGLLALGDSDYDDFCGFGHKLQRWLLASGAQALFDPVEVDSEDDSALRRWQHHLAVLAGGNDLPDWQTPRYQRWQLVERRVLNPGSVGEPCFHIGLRPLHGGLGWQAGDLVEIGPCQAPQAINAWLAAQGLDGHTQVTVGRERLSLAALLARSRLPAAGEVTGLDATGVAAMAQRLPHREYSIASLPADGAVHLLVRQMRGPGGRPGLGSSWLTGHAALGTEIALRVRSNVNFHAPAAAQPLILIGNGTGMAALYALLKSRIAAGRHANWLLFGERQAAHDFYYREQIESWLERSELARADFAWSRDQADRIYVQHRLRAAAGELRRWVEAGAAIYVCGSLDGMAPAVDGVLRDVLGAPCVEQLRASGRYRRDVY